MEYKQETILAIITTMNEFSSRRDGILAAIERIWKDLSQRMCLETFENPQLHLSRTLILIIIINQRNYGTTERL